MLSFGMHFLYLNHCCFHILQKSIIKLLLAAENCFSKKEEEMRLEKYSVY